MDDQYIEFQAFNWEEKDHTFKYPNPIANAWPPTVKDKKFVIYCFGCTQEGQKISLSIEGFRPYFYLKATTPGDQLDVDDSQIYEDMQERFKDAQIDCVDKIDGYTYQQHKTTTFYKLSFKNLKQYNDAKRLCRNLEHSERRVCLQLYQSNITNTMKYINDNEYKYCGWYRVKCPRSRIAKTPWNKKSKCFNVTIEDVSLLEKDAIAPFMQASFDIEVNSHDGQFPSPHVTENAIIQIATVFKKYGAEDFCHKHVVVLADQKFTPSSFDEDASITIVKTEAELLLSWSRTILEWDPDIIYSYNGDKFDWDYVLVRAEKYLRSRPRIPGDNKEKYLFSEGEYKNNTKLIQFSRNLSRVVFETDDHVSDFWESMFVSETTKRFESSAYGTEVFHRLVIPGRLNFDILIYIKRTYQLPSYSLNAVSRAFLKETKLDLPPKMIFQNYRNGRAATTISEQALLLEIARYCIQDTLLPQKLVDKMLILESVLEMANCTHVPLAFLQERGQQIKCLSQIIRFANAKGILVPDSTEESDGSSSSYKGATVLEPSPGYYEYVATLDFASLYPSIIMAHKLCYTTLVLNKDKYENQDQIQQFSWDEPEFIVDGSCTAIVKSTGLVCGKALKHGSFCGVHGKSLQDQPPNGELRHNIKSTLFATDCQSTILPELLNTLYLQRKAIKRQMSKVTDTTLKNILDKRQLAVKVSMNSIYGFTAANVLPAKEIAQTITSTGRKMIEACKDYTMTTLQEQLQGIYQLKVVAGDTDSIFIHFAPLDRLDMTKEARLAEIMNLSTAAADEMSKQLFKAPIKLEFEKVYSPLIIFKKKRYVGALYTSPEKYDKIDKKGVISKRRDNCQLARTLYESITKIMLQATNQEEGIKQCFNAIESTIQDLIEGRIPLADLEITKSLKDNYKSVQAHKSLADRLMREGFEIQYVSGDRIPFVFATAQDKEPIPVDTKKAVDAVVHPSEIGQQYQIDALYYVRKQLEKPIISFFKDLAPQEVIRLFEMIYHDKFQEPKLKVKLPKD